MQKKRIVIAAEIFPPTIGGPATYAEKLAYQLHESSHKVSVLSYGNVKKTDNHPFPVECIMMSKFKVGHYLQYIIRLFLQARKADIVFAQGPVAAGLPAYVVCWILSKPLVIKVVGDYAWEQASNRGQINQGIDIFQKTRQHGLIRILQQIECLTTKNATAIIVPSNYLKSIVQGWGVAAEKIIVIYNAAPTVSHAKKHLKTFDTIVSYGRFVPWKGFKTLIQIMPALVKRYPRLRLLILGRGPQEETLRNEVVRLGMDDHIKIHHMKSSEREGILAEASLFVLNTGYEGLSHALLEVMASGVPIITTNVGGNPELIEHGRNGLLVPFDNADELRKAIEKLYTDKEMQKRFSVEGQSKAAYYSEERMFAKTIEFLESL